MAPSPQEMTGENQPTTPVSRPLSGDEVVITGMSGIFPKSNSVMEFMENLYNKVDMVSSEDPRWIFNHPEVPTHLGKVNGMKKFDAQFFRVHYKQACTMEPMSRKLLEHAYSAIYDSGINPLQLRGKKVGVFIGATYSESEKNVIYETIQRNGFGITGCNKAMYANRVSYWIDGKGPSYALDLACSSSSACLEHAYRSISTGQCDAAIVGGCNLCMHPCMSLNLMRAGFLCLDGKSKCFDKNGDGYVRSDAISVLFLQKARDAKRIYSEVYHAKANYSLRFDDQFLSIRHPKEIEDFLQAFYSEIDVSPEEVEYVEGHGSALAEADGNELEAIGKVFAKDKTVKVGSVVSNMGHSQPASGVCALTKVCLAYHKGELPANLHYTQPQDHIPSVKEGKIEVLQENVPFERGFTAVNSISYSGANVHVLLKGHYKKKDPERYKTNMPRIVLASGRQEDCVMKIFNILKKQPVDPEQIGLLHNIHENEIPGHMCRGYILLDTNLERNETVSLAENVDHYPGNVRPIWFVYSGMGSQWATMGAGLMTIPIFAAAIEKCRRVLEPKGIDLMKILIDPDKSIYDNILHSFVGIAAVQIGLTDILKEIGVVPDNIIGHSVGELGCAYADGCFTAEEMILSAYSRGLVSVQTPFIKGSMAAVGLGYKKVLPMCPPGIEVACHNSSESSTISGPADLMKEFVGELTKQGVFAKEVPCSNIAYHSKYIADAGPSLLKYLSEVITEPKSRSPKWVSTSVPQSEWDAPKAQFSSAEYHTNNLLNSVLFEETSKLIPSNAIVIEIAPHGLLQAILKRSLPQCTHIPLTRRGNQDPVKYLLDAIGKIYIAGVNPKVDVLYPKIEFPVSTETSLLSHFVDWEHSENWPEAQYNTKDKVIATSRLCVISIHDDDYKYLQGHVRDGVNVFPEAAILVLVWETLAMYLNTNYRNQAVTFKDIQFHTDAIIDKEKPLKLHIMIYKGNDAFEVSCDTVKIASGNITPLNSSTITFRPIENPEKIEEEIVLTSDDFYKIMYLKGFDYRDLFRSVETVNFHRMTANIKWTDDYITFLDSLIQFNIFEQNHEGLSVPKIIRKLTIDPFKQTTVTENQSTIEAQIHHFYKLSRCGGLEMEQMEFSNFPVKETKPDVLMTQTFIPHFLTATLNLKLAIQINIQIVAENGPQNKLHITNMLTEHSLSVSNSIEEVAKNGLINVTVDKIKPETVLLNTLITNEHVIKKSNMLIVDNLVSNAKKMDLIHSTIPKDSFVLAIEDATLNVLSIYGQFYVITALSVQNKILILLKKIDDSQDVNVTYIPITHDKKFSWVPRVQSELQKSRKIVLVSEKQPYCGLLGLVRKLKEGFGKKIGLVVIDDYHAASFHPGNEMYKKQMQKNLSFNIYKKGQWGGYYYLPSETSLKLENATLTTTIFGSLESLSWMEAPLPTTEDGLVKVKYAALSLKDVKKSLGQSIDDNKSFGMDFSGYNKKGERVMGLISKGALSSIITADPILTWPVPEYWSLEDAATVPLPYVHAYYCLVVMNKVYPGIHGKRVFVNGGAGALGQAVIAVCLAANCIVYTCVSDIRKKRFLMMLFPELDEKNIGNSRDGTFEDIVNINTKGKGCHILINCANGTLRQAAMRCSGEEAVFMDVDDYDSKQNCEFGMSYLNKKRNYLSINISRIFEPENVAEKIKLQWSIADGIKSGTVKPLSRVIYEPNEITRAFRLLSSSKHIGRVVIKMTNNESDNKGINVLPRMSYTPKGTHVIVCDENGLAIELVDHLICRGARKFILNMKSNMNTGYFYTKSMSWKKLGISLQINTESLQYEKGTVNLLNEGSKSGPIHGIFVVQTLNRTEENFDPVAVSEKFNDTAMVVANLDLISRNICMELKYFVVMTGSSEKVTDEYAASVSEKICAIRNEVGLPALAFRVGKLNKFDSAVVDFQSKSQLLSYSAIFSALETSLKLNYKNVQAFNLKKRTDSDFLEKIEKILGIKNINNLPKHFTLEDLSANHYNIEEIIGVIKNAHNISYPLEKAKKLKIGELIKLKEYSMKKSDGGLNAFFTFIDNDECLAAEPMVMMQTKIAGEIQIEDQIDTKPEYLMLIPGFEGHYQIFESVCERLKIQAAVFQLGPDLANDTIQEMASNILKFMKKQFELKSNFYLLGYSFGVNVALELTALLEKEGHIGKVFCLDSSPEMLRVQLSAYVGSLSETELQNAIVEHMYKLMAGKESIELKEDLQKIEDWPTKVDTCVNRLRGLVNYSHQYKKSLLNGAYNKITLAREYEPNFKLKSELILMKGTPHPNAEKLEDDYGLSKYSYQNVKVFNIEADHALAPHDSRVSNFINGLLDTNVIEEFKKKSLCEVYYADPFKIL
ncbi:unnamed protein product [Chilo suppressalis]|uniref:Uncharacterized protein n=1 Tax=Chilo suppressalis TaxID=168631 RepID=A0ABN8EEY3_CHISP|nr:unnamed protein product [Chilo suppressalis]